MPVAVVYALAEHLAAFTQLEPDALVFAGPVGQPLRRSNFNKSVAWHRAVAIGVPHRTVSSARRCPAKTLWAAATAPPAPSPLGPAGTHVEELDAISR